MKIHFLNGNAERDINDEACDECFLCDDPCDSYLVLKIDGVEKFQSLTIWNKHSPKFDVFFTSDTISKNANIAIEMWDNDGASSPNDLMVRWSGLRVDTLTSQYRYVLTDRRNKLEIVAKWQKE